MSVVVPFPERGPAAPSGYLECECGEAWFALVMERDGRREPGAVAFDADGRMMARTGALYCMSCGRQFTPTVVPS